MIELTLPAGSLQAALAAFEGGADGVYLGLEHFSARAAATNFSFADLQKIRSFALSNDKKIYVTLNTLIDEANLPSLTPILRRLETIGCDGVIVQDLGVARIIRTHFPSLALHGSTQLAVHTASGVAELKRLGFERVVLARELTIEEVASIRKSCTDIELKVFIHGALCYSVSGQCMASIQLSGRSANEGSCAQICRNYFHVETDPSVDSELSPLGNTPKTAWFFSMGDLATGEAILQLAELGIESVKVEGRMKSPVYAYKAAQAYRALLTGDQRAQRYFEELAIAYSRRQTGGWLTEYGRTRQDFSVRTTPTLGSIGYPAHRGLPAAKVLEADRQGVWVEVQRAITHYDGLMYLVPGPQEPVSDQRFGVSAIHSEEGEAIRWAEIGDVVHIDLPPSPRWPEAGETLYMVSAHDQNLALYSEAILPYAKVIPLTVTLEKEAITIASDQYSYRAELAFEVAERPQETAENFAHVLARSDTSSFTAGQIIIDNQTELELSELFYPISQLHEIRRLFYANLEEQYTESLTAPLPEEEFTSAFVSVLMPDRSLLVDERGVPWHSLGALRRALEQGENPLFAFDGYFYLPLPSVMFEQERFFADLDRLLALLEERGLLDKVRFGLNNIGQIPYFQEKQLPCFADIYLYLANSESAKSLAESNLKLIGGYLWLERTATDTTRWPFEPTVVDAAFTAPAFISRSCFRHDSLLLSCEGCPHHGSWIAKANTVEYRVLVDDCVTVAIALR
ncbi:MAG TPA: DUF3656 domain-containing protein [Sphaerochaeta sp.]|nr:DUF3656 domain-containing protein [Sphaerochaeta sp.]